MTDKRKNLQEILLSLYEALVSGCELKLIAKKAQAYLANPLIVADKSCRVICSIGLPEDEKNEVWSSVLKEEYYPAQYLEAMAKNDKYRKIYAQQRPILFYDDFSKSRCMMFPIAFGGTVMGFAQLVEMNRPISPSDGELFAVFCKIAGTALCGKKPAEDERKRSYEFVLTEILDKKLYGDRMREQLRGVNIEFKAPRCLFVIEKADGEKMHAEYVRSSVESMIRNGQCSMYNNKIVVLVKPDGSTLLSPKDRVKFKTFLTENELICGGSGRFEDMGGLTAAYNQAVTASRIGSQMEGRGPIYFLWEYTTYQMCDDLYSRCDLMDFCNPMIVMIHMYDGKNKTQFLKTIREYIKSGCSPIKTAKNMGVHRNTIDYRLSRMKEIFDLNIDDPEMMFSFWQSFQIIYYLEKNGRAEGRE